MNDEERLHKVDAKRYLGIYDEELIKLISKGTIRPYKRTKEGHYVKLSEKLLHTVLGIDWNVIWDPYRPLDSLQYLGEWVDVTEEDIKYTLDNDYVWFNRHEIDDAIYEGKITISPVNEKKQGKMTVIEAGQTGKREKNPVILEAIRIFLEQNPSLKSKNNTDISASFIKKYQENKPLRFTFENITWKIFYKSRLIFSTPIEQRKNNKTLRKESSIKISTFKTKYIPAVKINFSDSNLE